MDNIVFTPKSSFIEQCCWNCRSCEFNSIKIPIYTTGMYYSVNFCNDSYCIERCINDLDIFFHSSKSIYITFSNWVIDLITDPDELIKINIPRSDGSISSWFCYGIKKDFSSFLVYENLSSSSLSKTVKYEKIIELNDEKTIEKLKNTQLKCLENIKLNILKFNKYQYDQYISFYKYKNKHIDKMIKLKNQIEYLPMIGIKYIYDFENIYKPIHNDNMKKICNEIELLPSFENFQGGIQYQKAMNFFNENK